MSKKKKSRKVIKRKKFISSKDLILLLTSLANLINTILNILDKYLK
ncbi:hypothetical protein [Clostridium sp. VAP23]|nr:hypothetical protein [Clostridium sp. VAP23]